MRKTFDLKISNDIFITDQRVSRGDIKSFSVRGLAVLASDITDESYLASEELFAIYGS